MNKTWYRIKNMFKSKEQREVEAKMEYNQTKRSFARYYKELGESVKNFSKMAQDAELSGNHSNAVSCAQFVRKLQRTQTRVQGLLQRFEMMNSMARLTGVMTQFMDTCTKMGFNMDRNINLKSMMRNTMDMEKALGKLDAMTDQMDSVFEAIDMGLGNADGTMNTMESEADAEAMLSQIMGIYNDSEYPQQNAAGVGNAAEAGSVADDTEERLRKMMEDLKN